jgi:hypothetical protein
VRQGVVNAPTAIAVVEAQCACVHKFASRIRPGGGEGCSSSPVFCEFVERERGRPSKRARGRADECTRREPGRKSSLGSPERRPSRRVGIVHCARGGQQTKFRCFKKSSLTRGKNRRNWRPAGRPIRVDSQVLSYPARVAAASTRPASGQRVPRLLLLRRRVRPLAFLASSHATRSASSLHSSSAGRRPTK